MKREGGVDEGIHMSGRGVEMHRIDPEVGSGDIRRQSNGIMEDHRMPSNRCRWKMTVSSFGIGFEERWWSKERVSA